MPRLSQATGLLLVAFIALPAVAQTDGFMRERAGPTAALKNGLEGKAPPSIGGSGWVNATKAPDLAALKGKVVLIDFWGTW